MRFAIVGKSLPHTISPRLHEEFGNFAYGVKEFETEEAFCDFVKSRELVGYNVTIPYKQTVIPLLDGLDDGAEEIGAVNTVVELDGRLWGYNTDILGVELAFKSAGIDVEDKNVLVLGSGGTSKTVQYYLKKNGAKTIGIVSRSGELNYDNVYEMTDTQIVVNTTPVGTMSIEKPLDLAKFAKLEGAFDVIYNPIETALVRQARKLGVKAIGGLVMLVEQGRVAHAIFCDADKTLEFKPESVTFDIVKKLERERMNVVLVGMAGCGKSTIGKLLAENLGKEFVDLDEEIEKREKKSIPEIFAENGEAYFREVERKVVADVCVKTGQVIATGGGAVLDERNVEWMKANGKIVWIERDVNKLARDGRPLSKDIETVKKLFESRKPIYESIADFKAKNNGAIKDCVESILQFEKSI